MFSPGSWATAPAFGATDAVSAEQLQAYLNKSYQELFELAPTLNVAESELARLEALLERAEKTCRDRFEDREKGYDKQLSEAQKRLRRETGGLSDGERRGRHCEIQHLRAQKEQVHLLRTHAIPVAYSNRQAKLKLLRQWPKDLAEIQRAIADGSYHAREHGDVLDIGIREVGRGQERDVEQGKQAVRQMKESDVMPPPVESELVQTYVQRLGERIAEQSDLRVPVQIEVLNSPEVNAFALPGGFLFVQRGLLEEAENEAQLVGVLSHEISHAAARHAHRLMSRASWSSLIYQTAQIAALILSGGASSLASYYLLGYGFQGLGLLLSLDLLGVSRDFELEADQLGVQDAWNAGYDPSGFVRFFDKMATTKGYVDGSSFFRTHPPFYERMVKSQQEITYLPPKDELVTNSPEFDRMKEELTKVVEAAEAEEEGRPSLKAPVEGCGKLEKPEYDPEQSIELLCGSER
jgi:hypothetical protein